MLYGVRYTQPGEVTRVQYIQIYLGVILERLDHPNTGVYRDTHTSFICSS